MVAIAPSERSVYWLPCGVDANTTLVPSADQSAISAERGAPGPCDAIAVRFDATAAPVSGSKVASVPFDIVTIASDCASVGYGLPTGAKVVYEPGMALASALTGSVHALALGS